MKNVRFKCRVCGGTIEMKKNVKEPFADWAYESCVEWSDFENDVPDFSEMFWERSSETPAENARKKILVKKPFDEKVGNEFLVKFEPALIYFNGWEGYPEEEIRKCAIVRCRFEKIIKATEYEAWIEISVLKVIPLNELHRHYDEKISEIPPACKNPEIYFENDDWCVSGWSGQGDLGETDWIYKDMDGKRHLIMKLCWNFDEEVLYLGNIVEPA